MCSDNQEGVCGGIPEYHTAKAGEQVSQGSLQPVSRETRRLFRRTPKTEHLNHKVLKVAG